ncbi:MAG: cytochrome C biogenesis protein [Firmicutes bacterium]|nr:cytochrome C biogenesis protein [Bacillota bacterium]
MQLKIKKVKISVTIPLERVKELRNAMCKEGAGIIGNYTYCSIYTKCKGTFKPSNDAHPYIGTKNKLEFVEEVKLEINCDVEKVKNVVKKLREVHPYEEPVINIIPLLDESSF